MKKNIAKAIALLLLFLVMLYAVKNIALNVFGKTITGYITNTTQTVKSNDGDYKQRYRNTASYYFIIDGKKYEGRVSYRTNTPIVTSDDQELVEEKVQYLDFFPYINTLKKYNEDGLVNYFLWVVLIVFCLVVIISIIKSFFKKEASKKGTKKKKLNEKWTCECTHENTSEYCDVCGRKRQ